jgi:hypothetical protein
LAGLFVLRSCFSGDEGQIRAQLKQLESLTSFPENEGNLQAVGRAKQLSELFAEAVTVDIRAAGLHISQTGGRQEIMQAAMAAQSQVGAVEANLIDVTVRLSDDRRSAVVEATGQAKITGRDSSGFEDFIIYFQKTDEGWLIERVENAQTFR